MSSAAAAAHRVCGVKRERLSAGLQAHSSNRQLQALTFRKVQGGAAVREGELHALQHLQIVLQLIGDVHGPVGGQVADGLEQRGIALLAGLRHGCRCDHGWRRPCAGARRRLAAGAIRACALCYGIVRVCPATSTPQRSGTKPGGRAGALSFNWRPAKFSPPAGSAGWVISSYRGSPGVPASLQHLRGPLESCAPRWRGLFKPRSQFSNSHLPMSSEAARPRL